MQNAWRVPSTLQSHRMTRVTVVTGAGGGIGRVIARAFASHGDDVVLAARRVELLEETRRLIEADGGRALVVPTDVTDPASVADLAKVTLDHFGHIDVAVNNSGVTGPNLPLWEIDPSDWEETFAVNVRGVFLVCRAMIPAMIEAGSGAIINIGSISGKRPAPDRSPYAAAKAALIGLTRTLAHEVGPYGIRVNLISPGFTEGPRIEWVIARQAETRRVPESRVRDEMTSLSPLGRFTRAEDVAAAALYLASPEAAAVTGADLNVSAGVVMY